MLRRRIERMAKMKLYAYEVVFRITLQEEHSSLQEAAKDIEASLEDAFHGAAQMISIKAIEEDRIIARSEPKPS
jgi:hypothetical protein